MVQPSFLYKGSGDIEIILTSPIPPSVNHYLGYRAVIQNGKPIATSYQTQEAKAYKKEFAEYVTGEASRQGWNREPDRWQHFYVDAVFYFDKIGRDTNNYFKVMLDAITDTKLIWLDDDVVCERVQRIYYDSDNPRIELRIHPVEYIGIFDNESQLDVFLSNCIGCTRFKRNCSVLRNAKIGRLSGDVVNNTCLRYKQKKQNKKE